MASRKKAKLYQRYPAASILIYNGATVLHFLLGGIGIALGYSFAAWAGTLFGALYLVLALAEMYIVMPLAVCPNCVYYRMSGAVCIAGMNVISRKIAQAGDARDFAKRAEGVLCPNNLYLASLILPLIAMLPALAVNFSFLLLALFLAVLGLLLFRFFVIFPKIACLHCHAKFKCPQAGAMGIRNL
jgi:hypothetical protein